MATPRVRLRAAAPTPLKHAFDVSTLRSFDSVIEPRLRDAAAALTPVELEELTVLAVRAFRGESKQSFFQALAKLMPNPRQHAAVAKAIDASVETYGVPHFMSSDLKGFPNAVLDEAYQRYRPRASRNGQLNALEWAIVTRSSRAVLQLQHELGPNYRTHLSAILKRKGMVTRLTRSEVDRFDAAMKLGIVPFREVRELSAGLGHLYEADHLLEQRFWRNFPAQEASLDFERDSFCYLVPKDAHVVALLLESKQHPPLAKANIRYSHNVKTDTLRGLIPHGREGDFSLQQIWDAHVLTFDSLGLARHEYQERLQHMFELFSGGLPAPQRTAIDFGSTPSWREFAADGV